MLSLILYIPAEYPGWQCEFDTNKQQVQFSIPEGLDTGREVIAGLWGIHISRCRLTSIGIPITEMSRSDDRLNTTVGFPILVRRHLKLNQGPVVYVFLSMLQAGRGLWVCHSRRYGCSGGGHVARMFGDGEEENLNSGMCRWNGHHGHNNKLLVWYKCIFFSTTQWRHNERDGVSNHWHIDCLLNRLFRCRSKKTLKLRVTGFCEGNSPVAGESPTQRASNAENRVESTIQTWINT